MESYHIYLGNMYTYEPWKDIEEDNVKIFHDVYLIDRDMEGVYHGKIKVTSMPMSPYCHVDMKIFRMWIDCGMPTSKEMGLIGNAQCEDIEKYYHDKIDRILLGE